MRSESKRVMLIANGFQVDYIVNLVNALAECGAHVQVIGSDIYPVEAFHPSVSMVNLRGSHDDRVGIVAKILRNITYYRRLVGYIARNKPEAIHIQWLNLRLIDGILLPLYFRLKGIQVVYTAHDVLPHSRDNFGNRILFRWIYRIPHHIVVHTDHIRARLMDEFHIPQNQVTTIPHGVYQPRQNISVTALSARHELGFEPDDWICLFFGIITHYKGLHLLLEAMKKLSMEKSRLRLIVAGRVSDEYLQDFEALLEKNNMPSLRIYQGYIAEEMVEKLFKSANLTVLPYLEASQSGVMFMSYAFGRPVLAPRMGGFVNDIVEGTTGMLFLPGKTESLQEKIHECMKKWPEQNETIYSAIRLYAEKNYSWKNSASRLIQLFDKV